MERTVELLLALQDLQQLQRDLRDKSYEEMGFAAIDEERIEAEVTALQGEIDPAALRRYDSIGRKYDRPLVPVHRGVCYGCFVHFPTARMSQLTGAGAPVTCESCGRLLYEIA